MFTFQFLVHYFYTFLGTKSFSRDLMLEFYFTIGVTRGGGVITPNTILAN